MPTTEAGAHAAVMVLKIQQLILKALVKIIMHSRNALQQILLAEVHFSSDLKAEAAVYSLRPNRINLPINVCALACLS